MHSGEGTGGKLHGDVVARVQSEDARRGRLAVLDCLTGQQEPAGELVAEVLLRGPAGGRADGLLTVVPPVEEAVPELVGDQEPPALPVEAVAEAPIDIVPASSRSWIDWDVELVTLDRDQQSLRPAAIRVETGAFHQEPVGAQPCLEIPQRFVPVVFGQDLSDRSRCQLRRLFLGAGSSQSRQALPPPRPPHPDPPLDHHRVAPPVESASV
jgi:hypothetical protein